MRLVSSTTLAVDTGTFIISNIPQTGSELLILVSSRGAGNIFYNALNILPNGGTWTTARYISDQESTMYLGTGNPLGVIYNGSSVQSANAHPTGSMCNNLFRIGNYTSTTIAKTMQEEMLVPSVNGGNFRMAIGTWLQTGNTNAVTSITMNAVLNYVAGSNISVYILD